MWTKIWTFCVSVLVLGSVRCDEENGTPNGVVQFLRNILSKETQQYQNFEEFAPGRSRRDATEECGGTVQGGAEILQSPGFSRGYAQDLLCVWKIAAPASKQLLLRFMIFDVKGGSRGICNPGEDYVMIRDGSRSGQRLGIFCNALLSKSSLPWSIVSVTNEVWIIFHTNDKDEGKGFLLSFQSVNSVKFSDYIADQITFEPSEEVGSSTAVRSSTEVKTTAAPTSVLPQSSVYPATAFPFIQGDDPLTPKSEDIFSFESVAIGNQHLGSAHFGDSEGSHRVYTIAPPLEAPLSLTDLSTQPEYRLLPEDTTATGTQEQSTSQIRMISSTDLPTSHHVLTKTEQPLTQPKQQFSILAKSFVATNKQQQVTGTGLPIAQTEVKLLTQTEQDSLLQSEQESSSLPEWQPATGVEQQMITELQKETQAVTFTQTEQKTTAQTEQLFSTKAMQRHTPEWRLVLYTKSGEPEPVTASAGQFVSSTEELHAAYDQPATKPQEQFFIQTKPLSVPEIDFLKPVTEIKSPTTSRLLPITLPGEYSVTQIKDVSEAKQQSVSKPNFTTKSWQQFVTRIEELPATEVKQEPFAKPDELQPTTKSLTTEQETLIQTQQLPSTSNLLPTTKPGSQFVTQTEELTNVNGFQQLTRSGQPVISQIGKLQTDAKQPPVTKPDGHQLLTRPLKLFTVPTIRPSVTETDNQEPGVQTEKHVGTESYKTRPTTKFWQRYVIPTKVPSVATAKTDDKPQYITELEEALFRTEQYMHLDTQTEVETIGTEQPTQMVMHLQTPQEQVSTAKYPKSTAQISVETFSDESKEAISQQHLPTPAKSTTTTEQHPDVKTEWQALTREQRKSSTTDSPDVGIKQTVPPPPPPSLPQPYPDVTQEPSFSSEDFDDPLTRSLSKVFNILGNVNLHDGRSIIQACQRLNVTMNETLEAFKTLSRLAQGLEHTKSLLSPSTPVEMPSVNLTSDAAFENVHLFPLLLVQTLEVSVSEIISKASEFLNFTIQNSSRIQSDIPEASCIQGYSQQLLNALQRDTTVNGSIDLVEDVLEDLFGFALEERLGPGLGIDDDQPTLTPVGERWDFNELITNPSGELQSPNYPDAYPMGVRYRWNITVRPRGRISLYFTHFDLDSTPTDNRCDSRYAHVAVDDGSGLEMGGKHVFCGQEVPSSIVSSSNTLIVTFISSYGYGTGFHANFATHRLGDVPDNQYSTTVAPDRVCGGVLTKRRGSIKSPNYPEDFETSVDCRWIVTVESGLIIALNFTDFNLDSSPIDNWCSEGYAHVKIIDGSHGNSLMYCGQKIPPLFISSTNTLTVSFVSIFGYGGRFYAFYEALQQDSKSLLTSSPDVPSKEPQPLCGGNLKDSRGVIQSPNYPGDFEAGVDCQWNVTVDSGLIIILNFTDFKLDSFAIDDWCSEGYAHVKVVDGNHGSSHVFCGQEVPPIFISSTNTLTVSFMSLFGYGGRFYAFYEALQQDSKSLLTSRPDVPSKEPQLPCGGNLKDSRGVIQSPNYPGDFEAGVDCQWNITVDSGLTIILNFTDFKLDSIAIDNWCSEGYAHVKVIDGNHGSSHVFCGQEVPPIFISSTNTLTVSFMSLFGYSGGFHSVYTTLQQDSNVLLTSPPDVKPTELVCGGNFNSTRGVIQVPDYSGDLETGVSCQWNIMVDNTAVISLTFTDFNLDSHATDNKCNEGYAHVKVVDGDLGKSTIYCGQELPPPFISTTNTLLVTFDSLYGYSGRFRAVYLALQTDGSGLGDPKLGMTTLQPSSMSVTEPLCGGTFNQPSGMIQLLEQTGFNCRWNITVESGWIILLTFTAFDIDSYTVDGQCDERYAHVKVMDRESTNIFCGQNVPPKVTSISRTLIVDYVGVYGHGEGFQAFYVVRDADFGWLDPKQVTAGVPPPSKSTQAHAPTDKSSYQCGGDLSLPYGTIESPYYSDGQATGITCRWNITVEDKWLIQLTFTDFNLDSASINGRCDERYDYLKIVDVETQDSSSEFVYCGQDMPNIYVSSANSLIVMFYTSFGYGGSFAAEYAVLEPDRMLTNTLSPSTSKLLSAVLPYECGGDISAHTGEIKSPNVPGDYAEGVNCVWRITLEAGSKIALSFTAFNLDSMPFDNKCDARYAHVLVIDGRSEETSPKHIFCGQDLPDDFVSTSSSLIVAFISQYGYGGSFQAHYSSLKLDDDYFRLFPSTSNPSEKTVSQSQPTPNTDKQTLNCGGVLDSTDGVLQSPYLSMTEKTQSVNCQWYIKLQEAGTITVVFEYFDLDSVSFDSGCDEMYANLKIIDRRTGASRAYCGQEIPPSFVASTNELLIIFSGLYGFSRGFRAEYHYTKPPPSVDPTTVAVLPTSVSAMGRQLPSCGSMLSGTYGEFTSPGYPNSYPANAKCSWSIFADGSHFIALKFLDFDVDNPMLQPDCSNLYSYVRVSFLREDGTEETRLLCGSEQPEILKLGTRSAVVYFESNLGIGRGFKASYEMYSSSSSGVGTTAMPAATETVVPPSVLTAQSGQILSPNYPVQFPHSIDKLWIIRPARQSFITLMFEDIDFDVTTSESGQCNTLYTHVSLTMYNIDSGNSELLICSNEMETVVYSYGELKLAFHSNYGVGRGFRATYSSDIRTGDIGFVTKEPVTPTPRHSRPVTSKESVMKTINPDEGISEGCLYTLTQGRGHFSSPDYPSMYPQEVVCQWIMLAPAGWLVRLDFSQFMLDSDDSPPCDTKYSHLVITTADSYGGRDYTYCGQQLPPRIISPTNRLVVTFRSMFGIDFGFFAAYQFISAETYQGSFGPVFTDGDKSTSATSRGLDTGTTTIPVSFYEGQSATRVTEGSLISEAPCEKVFSSPEGVIRSPYFPQGMPQGEECTWTITVPGEQGIHLTFLDFYLDDYDVASTCSGDTASVSVLMDGSQYEFCGNGLPSPLISTGNSIVVELKTMSGNGPGFRMHFIDSSLVSADSVTSYIPGDITESGTSVVDFRFLGEGGMTGLPDGDKRDFTRPDRERVNVPVLQPDGLTSTQMSNDELTATFTAMTTGNEDNIATLSGYTSQAKMTGIGSTANSRDVLTSHQLRITAVVCGSVAFILFIILILVTTICICKRRKRHSSKSVNMGQSEKSYWQNYKSWAREYSGGPKKPEAADEEGVEAVPIPEQERLV